MYASRLGRCSHVSSRECGWLAEDWECADIERESQKRACRVVKGLEGLAWAKR